MRNNNVEVIRYAVRPDPNTKKGWFVWAVVRDPEGLERWHSKPFGRYQSKRMAKEVAGRLNDEITFQF